MENTQILIADDHPLFRAALKEILLDIYPHAHIEEADHLDKALFHLQKNQKTQLALMDLSMPGMRGLSSVFSLQTQHPHTRIVIVSGHETPEVIDSCLSCGIAGFIPKSSDREDMLTAIRAVMQGKTWRPPQADIPALQDEHTRKKHEFFHCLKSLTPQQFRVLMMLREGLLNKQIAYECSISESTIKAHVSAILTKLGVESRTQAVILATQFIPEELEEKE